MLDESGWERLRKRYASADVVGMTLEETRVLHDALMQWKRHVDIEEHMLAHNIFNKIKLRD